jgi:hypothetical protein
MANTENATKAKAAKLIVVKVAPRKSVEFEGKLYLPGDTFEIDIDEAKDLHGKGFVVDPNELEEQAEAGPGVTAAE